MRDDVRRAALIRWNVEVQEPLRKRMTMEERERMALVYYRWSRAMAPFRGPWAHKRYRKMRDNLLAQVEHRLGVG